MKIVNIFGLVVAVHVAVLLLVFAIPGCRSTSGPTDPMAAAAADPTPSPAAPTPSPIQPMREMSSADLNPPVGSSQPSVYAPTINTTGSGRVSPQRPSATTPAASPSTPTITSMESAPSMQAYTVVRGDNLWNIAKKHGTTVRELASSNNLSANATLQLGQQLLIPGQAAAPSSSGAIVSPVTTSTRAATSARPASTANEATKYVIRSGDTLGAIARRHQTTVSALKAMNNLRSDLVKVGDTLVIPQETIGARTSAPAAAPAPAPAGPTIAATTVSTSSAPVPSGDGTMKHIVAPGEALGSIARKYGVRLGDLAMTNNIADPSRVRPGQELIIPGVQAPAANTAKAPVPTQYTPSFDDAQRGPANVIYTKDDDNVPVIRVEENVPTIRVEPAPSESGATPPPALFN